ncbi:MAG: hypothetical protein HKN50_05365 [Gammaproteobacteria bacterium]|nr:hypothetical protein [Gammaproteobacteria bacterium]
MRSQTTHHPRLQHQHGISLVELMISMVIALVLAGAVLLTYSSTRASFTFAGNASQVQEAGRFAINHLAEDIRLAGYWGNNTKPSEVVILDDVLGKDQGCGVDFVADMNAGFRVLNDPTNLQLPDCIDPDNHLDGSDIIITRHAGAPLESVNDIRARDLYFNAGAFIGYVFAADANDTIDAAAVFTANPPPVVYPYEVFIYYVRNCSDPGEVGNNSKCDVPAAGTPGDDTIPTLVRMTQVRSGAGANPPGTFREDPIAENIEDMQVIVGEDTDGDNAIDRLRLADTVVDWDNVHSAEISLLVKAPVPEADYLENVDGPVNPVNGQHGSYSYGGKTVNKSDNFRRRVYTSTVFLRNDPSENTYEFN